MFIVALTLVVFHLASYTAATDCREAERIAYDAEPQLNIEQYVGRWYQVIFHVSDVAIATRGQIYSAVISLARAITAFCGRLYICSSLGNHNNN